MGTASTKKFIKNNAGVLTEEAALTTSAGAGDANRLPALNASGILDDTILNASASSAANKVVKMTAGGIVAPAVINAVASSAGAGDSAKIVQLDGTGRIDTTMMPVGIGADVATIAASENLAAGDFVNIHDSTGAKVRKADATTAGKEAHGFVLSAVTSGNNATVYFEGPNTGVTGATPGVVYLATTAGGFASAAPSSSGNVVQRVGVAVSATGINFEPHPPVVLV
ncbi:MAG: hypothetical protein KA142_11225 [Chromatiaceae bacterium]|nr:hypothetical protein [Chromatiaceae bacterium]